MPRLLLLFICTHSALSQIPTESTGARTWALANALVGLPHSQSYFGNSAGITYESGFSASASIDTRFNIPGLSTSSLCGTWSKNGWGLALGGMHFGDKQYSENSFGLALAKKIGRISLSAKVEALGSFAKNYVSKNTLLSSFGLMADIHPKIRIGFHAQNLTKARLSAFDPIPTILRSGLAYKPIEALMLCAESRYVVNDRFYFGSGLEYSLRSRLFLRSGIDFARQTNHFGLGYRYQKWQLDYAVNTHPTLGLSHHISLTFKHASS